MKPEATLRVVTFTLLAVLGLITLLTYTKFSSNTGYVAQAEHTREVMVRLESVVSAIRDAETNQRGYLLTLDSIFLIAYDRALTKLDTALPRLNALVANDPVQSGDLEKLTRLIAERRRVLEHVIELRQPAPHIIAVDSLYAGNAVMGSIRARVNTMMEREEKSLNEAQSETSSLIAITPLFLLLLSLFSIVVLSLGYIFIARELRLRQRAQRALENKVEALNKSNRELEQFAYVASHDLQEPLRKIQAFGDRLMHKHGATVNDDVRVHIEKMQNAAARMQTLIDDLLSYSRVLHLKKEFETTDLNEVWENVLTDLEVSIRNKHAVVIADLLPTIDAVRLQMYQLFQNLLSNALKFSKPTSPPRVTVKTEMVKGSVIPDVKPQDLNRMFHCITLSDNGIGFNAEYSKKIFVIFQQLHNKLEFGGTGIGLAVCKRIAENHGGYIVAQSKPGEGSSFYLYLPQDASHVRQL
jgi:signal transduction histidine kinase